MRIGMCIQIVLEYLHTLQLPLVYFAGFLRGEPLKTHFSDATCQLDDNISKRVIILNVILNTCRCHFV